MPFKKHTYYLHCYFSGFLEENTLKHTSFQSQEAYFWKWHSVTFTSFSWSKQGMEPGQIQGVERLHIFIFI